MSDNEKTTTTLAPEKAPIGTELPMPPELMANFDANRLIADIFDKVRAYAIMKRRQDWDEVAKLFGYENNEAVDKAGLCMTVNGETQTVVLEDGDAPRDRRGVALELLKLLSKADKGE